MMDRLEAMGAFVMVADASSFAAAARKLRRSPASVTRAVAMLEARLGTPLFRRTTRVVRLTEAGETYLATCRRVLAELAEAETRSAEERAVPRGLLSLTAPTAFGKMHVRPVADAFLAAHSEAQVRLLLLDRVVNMVDEGIDVAVRIAELADSSLVATKVGELRGVLCASPAYLARAPKLREPSDLAAHACISLVPLAPTDSWSFGGERARAVRVRPRLSVNGAEAAIASALEGRGVARVLSYQVDRELRDGRLLRLLPAFEPEPVPVHLVQLPTSTTNAKVRAFVDLAVPALRAVLRRGAGPEKPNDRVRSKSR